MFTFQKLPVEINYRILELLPKETLFQCMLVCKYWSTLAIPAYYNTIYLSGTNIEFLNSKLLLDDKDQDQQFAYGKLVKSLISPEFHCFIRHDSRFSNYNSDEEEEINTDDEAEEYFLEHDEEEDDDDDDNDNENNDEIDVLNFDKIPVFASHAFIKLLSYMPNLKKIDLFTSAYYEFYMTILITHGRKYLKHIEDISIHTSFQELHFNACYEFRQTITHLELYYSTYNNNHIYGDPIYFLPHFTHLTNLTIKNFEREDLTLFDILNICPHLTALDFDSNFHVPDYHVDLSLKNAINLQPMNYNLLYPKLKVLDLTLPRLSTTYILYLIKYTNINSLSITLFDSLFDDWIKQNSMEICMNFINRLSRLNNLSFCTRFAIGRSSKSNEVIELDCFLEFIETVEIFCPKYYKAYLQDINNLKYII